MSKDKEPKVIEEHYVAPKRRKAAADSKYYRGTISIPRETFETINHHLMQKDITLQGFLAEAIDIRLRQLGLGTFYPEGWQE